MHSCHRPPSPSRACFPRAFAPRALTAFALAAALAAGAQTAAPAAPSTSPPPASAAVVNHLVSQLESRELPAAAGPLGIFGRSADPLAGRESEQQLRQLGARAASAAPRIAALLLRSDRYASELAWTLWSISPEPGADELPALAAELASARGAERLQALAKIGRTRSALALPALREAGAADDAPARLLAAVAIGYQREPAGASATVATLAAMLKDRERSVRQAALNGLRLQGPRAAEATPALIEHLRGRDNVWMTAQVLAVAPTRELLPIKPELEALLAEPKLTEYQKQPVVQLLLRLENDAAPPVAMVPALPPGATVVAPAPPPRLTAERQGNVTRVAVEGSLASTRELGCIELAEVRSDYTPPDLHTGIRRCFAEGRIDAAARLFLVSGAYASFDAQRVADPTARGGGAVLISRSFSGLPQTQKDQFVRAAGALAGDAAALESTCATVARIGPPRYAPKYLVLHGIKALTATGVAAGDGLVDPFDADATWARVMVEYLRCPTVPRSRT